LHLGHLLTRAAQRYPKRSAWLQEGTSIPFPLADERANRLANALTSLGGRQGDRVGMLLPNCYQGVETIIGPMKAGMAVVPMNVRLHPTEHQYLLNDSGSFALVYGEEFRSQVAQIRDSLGTVKHFICVGNAPEGDIGYEALLEFSTPQTPSVSIGLDELAWIFYTSGTTGRPKGAMLTHRNLLVMLDNFLMDINPVLHTDVLVHVAPITHASGMCVFHHIACGATSAFPLNRSFEPALVFAAIQEYRATTMFLAPTMVNMLVASPERAQYDLSSLHTVIYGGSSMYRENLMEAIGAFGNIFVQIFGQGEAPMTITTLSKEEHLVEGDPARLKRLTSAGREVTGVRVRVVDEEERDVSIGHVGEIVVRSDLVMKGYWNSPDVTAETLKGGWLHTGDLGYLDDQGYLFITDRKKDMIISGGANIYPREVEEVFAMHPAVSEVSVIGVPDKKWGEAVKALVVLNCGSQATAEEMIRFCKDHLASYKKPQSVEFLDNLPKNAYGKVLKRQLRERYWADQETRV
jgi:acyl-CoA synthetase (AMP-forming)/AMP-acid ligase II